LNTELQEYLNSTFAEHRLEGLRSVAKVSLTAIMLPRERLRARRLALDRPVSRLHLGCADTYLTDWINVDLARPGRRLDLCWDLRRALPFRDGAVQAIFSEHLWEHLPPRNILMHAQECRRVLVPDGILRIGVPDLERYISSYMGNDPVIADFRPDSPTPGFALLELFYRHQHRSMWDLDSLAVVLTAASFRDVRRRAFGDSALNPCPDSENRRLETLYIEARA
jgi:predicted SAM-dependent methyltransferase